MKEKKPVVALIERLYLTHSSFSCCIDCFEISWIGRCVCRSVPPGMNHTIPTTPTHTDKITYCESLAMKTEMTMILDLPVECRNMERVQKVMQEKRAKVDPFAGMSGAHKVKGNYVKGQETHHQIQRRLTTGATIGQRRFSKLDK